MYGNDVAKKISLILQKFILKALNIKIFTGQHLLKVINLNSSQ